MLRFKRGVTRVGDASNGITKIIKNSIVAVFVDGTSNDTLNWQFRFNVFTTGPSVPELQADDGSGMSAPDTSGGSGFIVVCQYIGKTFSAGQAWQMLTDPSADLSSATPFVFPASGVTS